MSGNECYFQDDFIRKALRRAFARTPMHHKAREAVKEVYYEGNRRRVRFTCAICGCKFSKTETHVDHIEPVIDPATGFIDWNTFIARLFTDKLQVLCISCHKSKTKQESQLATNRRHTTKTEQPAKKSRSKKAS
jgi:5-methylcytosine-specific restriction endonuclease McrA